MDFHPDQAKGHRQAIDVPRGDQQGKPDAKKPRVMLAGAPLLRHGILGTAFVSVTAIAKEIQHPIGRWGQGGQEVGSIR